MRLGAAEPQLRLLLRLDLGLLARLLGLGGVNERLRLGRRLLGRYPGLLGGSKLGGGCGLGLGDLLGDALRLRLLRRVPQPLHLHPHRLLSEPSPPLLVAQELVSLGGVLEDKLDEERVEVDVVLLRVRHQREFVRREGQVLLGAPAWPQHKLLQHRVRRELQALIGEVVGLAPAHRLAAVVKGEQCRDEVHGHPAKSPTARRKRRGARPSESGAELRFGEET